MNRTSVNFSVPALLRAASMAFILSITMVYASTADARQGCGVGNHRCYRTGGNCVKNGVCVQDWYHGSCWVNGRYVKVCNH